MMMQRGKAVVAIRRCQKWLVLAAVLFSLGCGAPKGDISGKATYQGKPLAGGAITFFNTENRMVGTALVSSDGSYSMTGVPVGPVKITVVAPPIVIGELPPLPEGKGKPKPNPEEAKKRAREYDALPRLEVPDKYKMPDKSGLTYTVQSGTQEHSIELK